MAETEKKILLEVDHLTKYFNTPKGLLHAVDGVSFTVEQGKTLGVVGESGCGKSTTGRSILKLLEPTSGKIIFDGVDITKYSRSKMRKLRTEMTMIFQDPFSSLDPRQSVMQLISEPIKEHRLLRSRKEIEQRTLELMDTVGLARRFVNSYPHELDGGRRQRIGIARALAGQSEANRLRRTGFRTGRFDSGADPEPAETTAKGHWTYLYLYHP